MISPMASLCIALAPTHPAEGLAKETCRNDVGPHVLSPMGPELDGVALCGPAMGVTLGHVVSLDCCPVDVARSDGGGS